MFIRKTKKLLSLLAATAMTVTAITGAMSVSASEVANGTCGDGITWTLDSDGKLTISGEGEMVSPDIGSDITLKDFSDLYTYKEHIDSIKEIVIDEGVTSIGFCAFYKLPNLETVILPSSITEFNGFDFTGGKNFNWDVLSYSFAECTALKNLTLTEGMTCIGGYAFVGCTSLESVKIPTTIKKWGQHSFSECSKLKNITLPEGLTVMGGYAFYKTAVERVVIPSTITQWNETQHRDRVGANDFNSYSFDGCQNLLSVIFTEGLKEIHGGFRDCPKLNKVVIPKSVNKLNYAFENCNGLKEAYIEEGVQISDGNSNFQNAFYNCTNLKRLEIPASIEIDYFNAQWCTGCTSLTDLYIHGKDYGVFPVGNSTSKVYCYADSVTASSLAKNSVSGFRIKDIEETIKDTRKNLEKAVAEAEKYAEEDYTVESYEILKTLLEKAASYGEDPGIISMEDITVGIYAAIECLVENKDEPSSSSDPSDNPPDSSSNPSDLSNPSDSSNNPSDSSNPSGSGQSQPSNSGSTQPTSAQPVTNAPTTASPKLTPQTATTVTKPAKVTSVKIKAKKKKLNVSWKKVSGATGYEVKTATNSKFTKGKKTVTVKKNKVIIKNLKSKKKYFVKVRAYKLANGRKYYGKWSKIAKKKTK